MIKKINSLQISIIILVMIFSLVLYYKSQINNTDNVSIQLQASDCDINKAICTYQIEKRGQVVVQAMTKPIPLVKKFNISLSTDLKNIDTIIGSFKGIDMEMGPNQTEFRLKDNYYIAEAMLPVCIRNKMRWKLNIKIKTSNELIQIPLDFITLKN